MLAQLSFFNSEANPFWAGKKKIVVRVIPSATAYVTTSEIEKLISAGVLLATK